MKNRKRILSILLCAAFLLAFAAGCAEGGKGGATAAATVSVTDSASRTVEIPAEITRIAPSGAVATMFLAAVCPEYLVSVSGTPEEPVAAIIGSSLSALPATGQLYGSKSTLNKEELLAAKPQIIIDFGDYKEGIAADLDALQETVGIPVVFLRSDLESMADAFRKLGTILTGKAERCEALAAYVEETLALAAVASAAIPESERIRVLYTTGSSGLDVHAAGSSQAQVLDRVGAANAAVLDEFSSKGTGTTVNMEQLYLFDPDVIVFTPESIYDTVASESVWAELRAVREGRFYQVPALPYNWLGNPPSMNMLLGIRWLGNLLYPEVYSLDIVAETQRAYKLLWNYDLSDAEAAELLSRSSLK